MNITQSELEPHVSTFRVEIAHDDYWEEYDKQLRAQRKTLTIRGFRPGHVPLPMAKRLVGERVLADVLQKRLDEALGSYLKEKGIVTFTSFLSNANQPPFDPHAAGECDSAFATVRYGHPIQRAMVVRNGYTTLKWPEYAEARTQDLEPSFHDAGQFYLATVEAFQRNGGFWGARTKGIEIPETQVQDLDNEVDWRLAELKYRLLREC